MCADDIIKYGSDDMQTKVTEFNDKTNFASNEYLHINSCGKNQNQNRNFSILRSKGRVDFHLIYVESGILEAEVDGKMHFLKKGDVLVYKSHQKQFYTHEKDTVNYWIHFSGLGAEGLLKRANLWIKSVYSLKDGNNISGVFDAIIKEFTIKDYQHKLLCEAKLIELVAEISRYATDNYSCENTQSKNLIYAVIEKMREDCCEKTDMETYANMCSLSKYRFEHLFKEITGFPPHRYLLKIRLEKALYLLNNTMLNVSEISNMTGFSDSLYFSRIFKKYYKVSPTKYRSRNI